MSLFNQNVWLIEKHTCFTFTRIGRLKMYQMCFSSTIKHWKSIVLLLLKQVPRNTFEVAINVAFAIFSLMTSSIWTLEPCNAFEVAWKFPT